MSKQGWTRAALAMATKSVAFVAYTMASYDPKANTMAGKGTPWPCPGRAGLNDDNRRAWFQAGSMAMEEGALVLVEREPLEALIAQLVKTTGVEAPKDEDDLGRRMGHFARSLENLGACARKALGPHLTADLEHDSARVQVGAMADLITQATEERDAARREALGAIQKLEEQGAAYDKQTLQVDAVADLLASALETQPSEVVTQEAEATKRVLDRMKTAEAEAQILKEERDEARAQAATFQGLYENYKDGRRLEAGEALERVGAPDDMMETEADELEVGPVTLHRAEPGSAMEYLANELLNSRNGWEAAESGYTEQTDLMGKLATMIAEAQGVPQDDVFNHLAEHLGDLLEQHKAEEADALATQAELDATNATMSTASDVLQRLVHYVTRLARDHGYMEAHSLALLGGLYLEKLEAYSHTHEPDRRGPPASYSEILKRHGYGG